MPGNILDAGGATIIKTDKNLCSHGAYILMGKTETSQINERYSMWDGSKFYREK